jgi:hypothetical protein
VGAEALHERRPGRSKRRRHHDFDEQISDGHYASEMLNGVAD